MTATLSAGLQTHVEQAATSLAICFRLTLTQQQPTIAGVAYDGTDVTIDTTYDHNLSVGDVVQIVDTVGLTGLNWSRSSNDVYYPVTNIVDTDTFEVADPGLSGTWTSGGEARLTLGMCNVDVDIVYAGVTHVAGSGLVPSAFRTGVDMAVDNIEATGVFSDAITIPESWIHTGKLDYAESESYLVNYKDLTLGKRVLEFGHMGKLKVGRNYYTAEFNSLSNLLAQDTMRVTSPDCTYDLGDADCKKVLTSFTHTGTITTATANDEFVDTARTEADGYFNHGLITFTSGLNEGLSAEVKDYTSDTFTLYEPMPYEVAVTDGYSAIAGCDKLAATCRTKFSNYDNYGGFEYLPGQAEISNVGNQRN